MKIDDKELEKIFLDIKQNKIQGIEELYSKYKKVVYGIAFTISKNKEDSEDIMQMIFAKIYEMENSKLPTNNYASWLYSTTKNETIIFLKKKKNNIPIDKIYEISDDNSELNKVIDNIEFNKLISKLNDKEKDIVSLKILSNFSFEEISKLLKEPVGTVKWRYYKSIYALKAILGNLAMFIVSFGIGIKALLLNKKSENIIEQESTEQNTQVQEDTTNTTTNITQDTNTTTQENTIYEEQPINNYNQYIGYSFLGISIIFFVDYNNVSNGKLPVFAIKSDTENYHGLGYNVNVEYYKDTNNIEIINISAFGKTIAGAIFNYDEVNNDTNNDIIIIEDGKIQNENLLDTFLKNADNKEPSTLQINNISNGNTETITLEYVTR